MDHDHTAHQRAAIAILAAFTLSLATHIDIQPLDLLLLATALTLTAIAALARRLPPLPAFGRSPAILAARVCMVGGVPFLAEFVAPNLPASWSGREVIGIAIAAALVALGWIAAGESRQSRHAFMALLGGMWLLGMLLLQAPGHLVDVRVFQADASEALFAGTNPFAITFPDIYPPDASARFYGPGISVDGTLQFGFPYPPLSLLLVAPAHLLFNDFRIAHLTALVAAAAMIGAFRRNALGRASAAVLLLVAPILTVVLRGWTEPVVVLGLAATVLASVRRPRATPAVFGLTVVLKQYMPLLLPAYAKLLPRRRTRADLVRTGWIMAAAAALVTIPFLLLDPSSFWRSVVTLQLDQPLRTDALSLLVAFVDAAGPVADVWLVVVPLLAAGGATAVCLARTPHGATGFALMVALVLLSWLAFTKQSFLNHYLAPLGALTIAAGATGAPLREEQDESS